jgi:hypothetical protein
MNGHLRDEIANDIDEGHPTLSAEADALAREVSRLSDVNEREAYSRELSDRAAASARWGEWMRETDRYLAEFDPGLVEEIKIFLTTRRDALRARARERGWDIPDD